MTGSCNACRRCMRVLLLPEDQMMKSPCNGSGAPRRRPSGGCPSGSLSPSIRVWWGGAGGASAGPSYVQRCLDVLPLHAPLRSVMAWGNAPPASLERSEQISSPALRDRDNRSNACSFGCMARCIQIAAGPDSGSGSGVAVPAGPI